jgi:hypothetical protein
MAVLLKVARLIEWLASVIAVLMVSGSCFAVIAYVARLQVLSVANGTGATVVVREVALQCNKKPVGTLRPNGVRVLMFRRTCSDEATYVLDVERPDGTRYLASACYIDKLPQVLRIQLTASASGATCDHFGLRSLLLDLFR